MKIVNGWVESPYFKLFAPIIPMAIVAILAYASGFVGDVRDTKNTVANLCSSVAEIKASADKLRTVADNLIVKDAQQTIEIETLKKQHDWNSPHIKRRGSE